MITCIVEGEMSVADLLARAWAEERGVRSAQLERQRARIDSAPMTTQSIVSGQRYRELRENDNRWITVIRMKRRGAAIHLRFPCDKRRMGMLSA